MTPYIKIYQSVLILWSFITPSLSNLVSSVHNILHRRRESSISAFSINVQKSSLLTRSPSLTIRALIILFIVTLLICLLPSKLILLIFLQMTKNFFLVTSSSHTRTTGLTWSFLNSTCSSNSSIDPLNMLTSGSQRSENRAAAASPSQHVY